MLSETPKVIRDAARKVFRARQYMPDANAEHRKGTNLREPCLGLPFAFAISAFGFDRVMPGEIEIDQFTGKIDSGFAKGS